jgi:hypothetical protein
MIKYLLYLMLILCVIKMYSNKLKTNDKIIYASISIFLGIIIIDWLLPKTNFEKIKERMQN